jgi:hypothetical protein
MCRALDTSIAEFERLFVGYSNGENLDFSEDRGPIEARLDELTEVIRQLTSRVHAIDFDVGTLYDSMLISNRTQQETMDMLRAADGERARRLLAGDSPGQSSTSTLSTPEHDA